MNNMKQTQNCQEQAVKQFLRDYLDKAKDEQTMNSILQDIGGYYDADRAYIFEAHMDRKVFNNTFEWCREGVAAEIDNLQNIPVDGMECWFEAFEEQGEFYISSLSDDYHPGSKTYDILEPQGIECLMAAPISVNGEVVGFLGVDNPRKNTDALLLLSVAASTCYSEIATERMMHEKLAETNQALVDRTRDAEARELETLRKLRDEMEIAGALSRDYPDVVLLDLANDTAVTIKRQGRMIPEDQRVVRRSYKDTWEYYISKYVLEEDRAALEDAIFVDKVKSALEKSDEYSCSYRVIADETDIHYYQASFIRIYSRHKTESQIILGFRCVDAIVEEARQQEMALRAAYDVAEAANKAKTDFLSNMSHDIRTPMNGIIGMTAIAAAHIDDKERVKDSLQKITRASKHLLSLINEVLDMSKIESGKVQLMEEEFNLSDLVDNLLTMISSQIEEHHHELSVNISDVTHEAVIGDSLRIQKVFTNLMSNAVKYTPDGGKIRLSISEKPTNQKKVGCYEFIFEDNGIGMSEEFLKHIFEPFVRAADEHVNRTQGTGLGMPISRNIVRMMGGDIKVESTPGEGSSFTVTIYLKLQEEIMTDHQKFIDLDVLVADDDALSLESCVGMLCDLGMKAEGVSSGAEAVKQVLEHHEHNKDYFACIIDWKMPDMDGIETTRAIRRTVGPDVPIIIISAYDWSDIEQEARAAGANAFISKPLFRSRLERTFGSLLGEEEAEDRNSPMELLEELDFSEYRALLVEDNELNAEIAEEILKTTGIAVEHVWNGMEAVDRMNECTDEYYDIVFMDIQMPRMNGYDATRAIRAMDRNYCKQIPIIAMTANAFAEDVLAAKTVGMNEHIAKPLDLNTMARILKKWM